MCCAISRIRIAGVRFVVLCHCERLPEAINEQRIPHDSSFVHVCLPRSPNGLARNDDGYLHALFCVIASISEAINRL